ncbi:hypothetical protein DIPPA_32661, partial [Diplonema papillatum]
MLVLESTLRTNRHAFNDEVWGMDVIWTPSKTALRQEGQKRVNLVGGGDPAHGEETEARPSPPGTPEATPKSRRKLRPSVQSATRKAVDAGANTAIENAAEGDDTRTAAGNEAAA